MVRFSVAQFPLKLAVGLGRAVIVMLIGLLAAAGAVMAAEPDETPTDFRDDIEVVERFLEAEKSYSPAARTRALAELARLREQAANMPLAAFELAVARIAALAQNGHTMLAPGWAHRFNRIPLRFFHFADGLYVVQAPDAMRSRPGMRLVSVDGHSVEELKKVFARYHGGNEPRRNELIPLFLESPALLHAAGLANSPDRVSLELESSDGTKKMETVEGEFDPPADHPFAFLEKSRLVEFVSGNAQSVPLWLADPGRWHHVAAMPELQAYYVQIRINLSIGDRKIDAFQDSALTAIGEAKPRNLIVDLRLDGGGDLTTTRAFMQALPGLIPDDGRIFALTSWRTFSAGIASLGYLKQAGRARVTIAGEPVGDHLEFWAEGNVMKLPVSGATLFYSTERHNYMTGCPEPDCHVNVRNHPVRVDSLDPDIAVPLTWADYKAGRDPALEAVAAALGQ